jgi:hypothetical protein
MVRTELKFLIKDALRGARYSVRQASRGAAPLDFPGRSELTGLADTMLTSIEETVTALRYGSEQSGDVVRDALAGYEGLRDLIGKPEFEDRFAARTYRLTKGLLARRGLDEVYLSELAYARAGIAVNRRLAALGPGMIAQTWSWAGFGALVTMALIEAAPVALMPTAGTKATDPFISEPNAACAAAAGLAIAAFLSRPGSNPVECADSAGDLTTAAFPRIKTALASSDPRAALAVIIGDLAPFVP